MCRVALLIVLSGFAGSLLSQVPDHHPRAGFVFMQGVNHMVVRGAGQESRMGHSFAAIVFGRFQRKRSAVFLEPCGWFGKNTLKAYTGGALLVKVPQYGIGLMPAAGFMFRDHTSIRVGVLLEWMGSAYAEVVTATGLHLSNSDINRGLEANHTQAAITLDFRWPIGRFRRFAFHVMAQQYLTPSFVSEYLYSSPVAGSQVVFTGRSFPTVVLAGFSVSFFKESKAELNAPPAME